MKATHRTARKQPKGRPWPKGVSGNPGGRPAAREANALIAEIFDEVHTAGRTRGEILIRNLFAMATDKNKSIALRATEQILDRRLGKPMQQQQLDVTQNTIDLRVSYVDRPGGKGEPDA